MIYAVIDTNVIVSALLSRDPEHPSPPALVLDFVAQSRLIPVYNDDIIKEYSEVLNRKKFRFSKERVKMVLELIIDFGLTSFRAPYPEPMPDEKDRVFYEVSLSNKDSFLVTGNSKHFPHTIKVVTPAEMIAILNAEK